MLIYQQLESNGKDYYYIYIKSGELQLPNIFKDTISTEISKKVGFQSISEEFTGYMFIWPENCKLTLVEKEEGVIIDRKYIQIPVKGSIKDVNISIESHDNGIENDVCRYYYNIYNTSSVYPLVSNVNYGFKVPKDETFKFEFNVKGETNPTYYIL